MDTNALAYGMMLGRSMQAAPVQSEWVQLIPWIVAVLSSAALWFKQNAAENAANARAEAAAKQLDEAKSTTATKIAEVHHLVDGASEGMKEEMKALRAEVTMLKESRATSNERERGSEKAVALAASPNVGAMYTEAQVKQIIAALKE